MHESENEGLIRREGFLWNWRVTCTLGVHPPPQGAISKNEEKFNGNQEAQAKDQGPEEGEETRSEQVTHRPPPFLGPDAWLKWHQKGCRNGSPSFLPSDGETHWGGTLIDYREPA